MYYVLISTLPLYELRSLAVFSPLGLIMVFDLLLDVVGLETLRCHLSQLFQFPLAAVFTLLVLILC